MPPARAAALGLAAAVAAFATLGAPAPGLRAAPNPARPVVPQLAGASGCDARGCHGGFETAADGARLAASWRNAATNWTRHDPHGGAYAVLENELSASIERNLAGPGGKPLAATADVRCLACHTTPALADRPVTAEVLLLRAEGVSCDACHTEAGHSTNEWLAAHTKGWAAGGLASCYADGAMKWLNPARDRAAVCAGCHVGAPADPAAGIPVREVTHDLIAAGHPRLFFEYASYVASLPPHWTERQREKTGAGNDSPGPPPHHEVRAWFDGERETARARLRLVADQAGRGATWPELAAFDCYACHHDLAPAGAADWRLNRAKGAKKLGAVIADPLGDPLRQLLRSRPEATKADADFVAASRLGADRAKTVAAARELSEQLNRLAPPADGRALLGGLNLAQRPLDHLLWDDAARTYFALAAASRDRGGAAGAELGAAADALRFPRGSGLANSPTGYEPAGAAAKLKAAAGALGR